MMIYQRIAITSKSKNMLLYFSKFFIMLNGLMFHRIRTYNGVCNNLKKKTMGAALAPYYSLIHPQYGN